MQGQIWGGGGGRGVRGPQHILTNMNFSDRGLVEGVGVCTLAAISLAPSSGISGSTPAVTSIATMHLHLVM